MNKELIVRAWKDPAYRHQLSAEERTSVPESPSGRPLTELEEAELESIGGGMMPTTAGPRTSVATTGLPTLYFPQCIVIYF